MNKQPLVQSEYLFDTYNNKQPKQW